MNPDRLLALFEPISEAPDAISRMRRFILDLAVRGKLVEQDPDDEPAEELLQRLTAERSNRRSKRGSSTPDERVGRWCSIPASWNFVRLDKICNVVMGSSPPGSTYNKTGEGVPLINGPVEFTSGPFGRTTVNQYTTAPSAFCEEGDFLICVRGSTTGRTNIAAFRACIGRGVAAIQPLFEDKFIRLAIRVRQEAILQMGRGIAFPSISREQLAGLPVPLPPLAEQHRIVAKVDELMALCDQLEAARMQRKQCRKRLVAASLQRLNQPTDDPEAFRSDARFALQVLPSLTTTPAEIKQLRQTILNLAICGKLVVQDPEDEPANLTITKALLAAADLPRKKGRRKASWSPSTENENQELPAGWHLFSLAELVDPASPLSYGVLVPGDNVPDGIPFVRAQDLMLKDHPASPGKKIAQEIDSKYNRTRLTGGEILVCVVGSIGKIGIAPEHWSGANIARAVARLKLIPEVSTAYMLLALQSGMIQGFFKDSTRTLAQPTLNISLIEVTPIPLPPLAEQHRIVSKVDELMALCNQLEQQLSQAEQSRRGLLEAVLQEALAEPSSLLQSA
jgi:type I restriction enzyme S subunit